MLEAAVFGLDPFSPYRLRVEAVNGAGGLEAEKNILNIRSELWDKPEGVWLFCTTSGSVSSLWVEVKTLEASPTGLGNFTVEQREEGRALLLSWDEPQAPNGVITVRNQDQGCRDTQIWKSEAGGFGAYLQQWLGKGRGTPWTGRQSIIEQHRRNNVHAHTHTSQQIRENK